MNECLMDYQNTPLRNFPYSPNQMLFSRQIWTIVAVYPMVLVPDVPVLLENRQAKYREL